MKGSVVALCLALGLCVDAQRRGGRAQAPRRGRQEAAAAAGYAAPGDVPVYGAASDAAPVYGAASSDPALEALTGNIPGVPGEDYPIFAEVPESAFTCEGQVDGGYYADPEAKCQAFHICTADGQGGLAKYSFLCPNGTIFNQNYFICDWWFNFDCSEAEGLYSKNEEIAAEREAASAAASDQTSYGAPAPAGYSAGAAAAPAAASYSAGDLPPPAAPGAQGAYEAAERAGRKLGNGRNGNRGGRQGQGNSRRG